MPNISQKDIVQRINAAIKAITVTDLNDSKLVAEQADAFIQTVEKSTPMLEECRRLEMTTPERNIDRTGFGQRIMKNPEEEDVDEDNMSQPGFDTNVLDVQKIKGMVGLYDDALEDNIEREDFEETLLEMIANRAGVDMELLFIAGDEDIADPSGEEKYLVLINGWLKLATHKLDADDFDVNDPESLFDALFRAIDRKYIRQRSDWRYYVEYDIEDDYRNVLKGRGTPVGDEAQTQAQPVTYKGIPVVPVGNMPEGRALLTHPDNTAYGIRRDIRVEQEREAKQERNDFIITARVDADYEDEDAAAVAEDYEGLEA